VDHLQISILRYLNLSVNKKNKILLIKLHQANHQVYLPVSLQILQSKLFNLQVIQDRGDEVMKQMIKSLKRKMTILWNLLTATKTLILISRIADVSLIHLPKSNLPKIIVISKNKTQCNSRRLYNRVKLISNVSL
jgi:hypothetical protein